MFPRGLSQTHRDHCITTWQQFAKWKDLRTFTSSGARIHQELLEVLGKLPHLETLSFLNDRNDSVQEPDWTPANVSDECFTSLRQLYLYGLGHDVASWICKVPALFRHLVKAVVVVRLEHIWETMSDAQLSDVAMECLGRNSPHLQDLTVYTRGSSGCFAVSWSTIDKFKHMPLRRLEFGHISFNPELNVGGDEDGDEGGDTQTPNTIPRIKWQDFLSAVPYLEELHLQREQLEPWQLPLFASHLPKLRLFAFGIIDLYDTGHPSDGTGWHPATQPIVLRGQSFFSLLISVQKCVLPDMEIISNAA
ncbi:hypothetical protein FRC07_002237, partial [Ceratobasidium sp. 392]